MSLAAVRNPWLRRSVVVVTVPFFLPLVLVVAAIEAAWEEIRQEWRDSLSTIRRAWRGER